MTIRHLKIFTVVADEGGMSKAAKKLYVSQPTVSQAIAELEKYYGVRLFERLSQKLYLTREGELMLSYSRHILDSFEQMEEAVYHAARKPSLRIGCSVSVGTCLINDILDEAKERIPECEINVLVENSADIEQAILNNEVDLGIVEGILKSRDLNITPVCEDELVIVCGKNHRLSPKGKITLDMLEGQDYISREIGSAERNQIEKIFEEKGIHLNRVFYSTNTEAIKNAVIRGRGIAVFSKMVIERECRDGEIVILPLEGVEATRKINLAIHKKKYVSDHIRILQDILRYLYGNG
ncbi:MAG: LysR family transcriptional regulator [Lachnospiraceae bacterium]|nr:LysR family transcriptional regulator [Lachnospiraceae bacterium]